ncbi:PIN domain-containing protein, partial [Acidithiobacillus ferriphilus]
LLSACRSRRGASHAVLRGMLTGEVSFAVSPAVVLEYESVLKRPGILGEPPWIRPEQIETILDALCASGKLVEPWFHFRSFLDDPKDDTYIDCALAGGASVILSRDRHFQHPAVEAFGLRVLTAGDFLHQRRSAKSNRRRSP